MCFLLKTPFHDEPITLSREVPIRRKAHHEHSSRHHKHAVSRLPAAASQGRSSRASSSQSGSGNGNNGNAGDGRQILKEATVVTKTDSQSRTGSGASSRQSSQAAEPTAHPIVPGPPIPLPQLAVPPMAPAPPTSVPVPPAPGSGYAHSLPRGSTKGSRTGHGSHAPTIVKIVKSGSPPASAIAGTTSASQIYASHKSGGPAASAPSSSSSSSRSSPSAPSVRSKRLDDLVIPLGSTGPRSAPASHAHGAASHRGSTKAPSHHAGSHAPTAPNHSTGPTPSASRPATTVAYELISVEEDDNATSTSGSGSHTPSAKHGSGGGGSYHRRSSMSGDPRGAASPTSHVSATVRLHRSSMPPAVPGPPGASSSKRGRSMSMSRVDAGAEGASVAQRRSSLSHAQSPSGGAQRARSTAPGTHVGGGSGSRSQSLAGRTAGGRSVGGATAKTVSPSVVASARQGQSRAATSHAGSHMSRGAQEVIIERERIIERPVRDA